MTVEIASPNHALDALSSLPAVSFAYVEERHARFAVVVLHEGSTLTGAQLDAALAHIPPAQRPLVVRRVSALDQDHAVKPSVVFGLDGTSGRYEPSVA